MTTIRFSPTERPTSTHRITDGMESSYFAWPAGASWDDVLQAYVDGYDFNGSSESCEVWCSKLDSDTAEHTGTIEA